MSSEGSVTSSGSPIRQFGLYRTIDARTEEFLRSSRKRQIRQGCACAAISTAITVTVVVSVILVYEYSINSESNVNKKVMSKPNWIGLMNDSDITSISSKFNKKINFDRTTLKLLPILLKALNKNRYLEKILEDYSSSSPPYVGKDTTEPIFTRNVFSNSKNWLKMPTSRHYTVDYKTSPLIHWKNPTHRLDYLTKIRKIRDYQRMLNYFDKMINDKVGSYQKKEFDYTENPLIAETVPMIEEKIKELQRLNNPIEPIKTSMTGENDSFVSCKCPKTLGTLLNKLIAGIQDMTPHMIGNKANTLPCANKTILINTPRRFATIQTVRPITQRTNYLLTTNSVSSTQKPVRGLIAKLTTNFPKLTTSTSESTSTDSNTISTLSDTSSTSTSTTTYTTFSTVASITSSTTPSTTTATDASTTETSVTAATANNDLEERTIQLPTVVNTLMPNDQTYEKNTLDYDSIVKPDELFYTNTTKSPDIKLPTTEMFVPIKLIDISNESNTEKWFDAYTLDPSYSRLNMPLYKEDEYDDYLITTPRETSRSNEFENLDVHNNMDLVKTKIMPTRDNEQKPENTFKKSSVKLKPLNYHPVNKQKDLDLTSMRRMADMIYLPQEKIAKEWKYTVQPTLSVLSFGKHLDPRLPINTEITKSFESTTPITNTSKTTTGIVNSVTDGKMDQPDTKMNIEASENVDDEFQDEDALRQAEFSTSKGIYKYKNTTKKVNTNSEKVKQADPWELTKNEEKIASRSTNSMLPAMRPIYLEIQRNNDWRQDDHGDYDNNFNNNIFDLPNIN